MDDNDSVTSFSDSESSHAATWWRWPLIPFACLLGASIGATVIAYLNWVSLKMMGGYSEDGLFYSYIMPIFSNVAFGFIWSWIACAVAPRGKVITGAIMTTILGMMLLLGITMMFIPEFLENTLGEKIQGVIGGIAMMIAAIAAVIQAKEEGVE